MYEPLGWVFERLEDSASGRSAERRRLAVLRYLIRMSTRCTPYGLNAAVSLAGWGERTASGERVEVLRARGQRLGQPELDGGADRLRDGPGEDQPDHAGTALVVRGCSVRHGGPARH